MFRDRAGSLRELLADSVAYGDRDYLVDGERRISYAYHHAAVCRTAHWLTSQGIRRGDRVAILGRNSIEWVVTFWATVSIGAVAVALNAWWSKAELDWALNHCEPALLVDDMAVVTDAMSGPGPGQLPAADIDEDDPAVILYTSGTSGRPKGATHSHRNLVFLTQAQAHLAASRLPPGIELPPPRVLSSTPLFHVSGLHSGVVANLAVGGTVIWQPGRFDAVATMATIERERATSWSTMPTTLWRLLNSPERRRFDLSSLRHIGGGGSTWSPALQSQIRSVFGETVSWGIGYGLTEASGLATSAGHAELLADPTTVGRPVATVELDIADPDDEGIGEIRLRGPLVMLGYWRDEPATRAVIDADGWLRTGDLGRLADDGSLRLSTRRTDLILRGAENVYPAEIEACLEGHPAVGEVAVVGVPDEEFGQVVAAIVVPKDGAGFDAETLRSWCAERLAYYKVPTRWLARDQPLPRTATGKVLRAEVMEKV